jgi:hypothetical protein
VLVVRMAQQSVRNANDVVPKGLPLILFVPHVRTLKKRDNESLGMHEYGLGRANLCFHDRSPLVSRGCLAEIVA